MTEQARLEAEVANLPKGVVFQTPSNGSRNYGITIWARTWSEVIEQCTGRLKFFQERLNYTASQSSGRKYLQDTYPKFIPRKATGERAA
jgi:hypothetical protein